MILPTPKTLHQNKSVVKTQFEKPDIFSSLARKIGRVIQRLGEKLRALRQKNGLSYRQLAAELDVTHVNLISIESGRSFPSMALLYKIAEYFDVSYDELLDDEVELDL